MNDHLAFDERDLPFPGSRREDTPMSEGFVYQDPFPLGEETTEYRLLTKDYVSTAIFHGREVTTVAYDGLVNLAEAAFKDVAHLLRTSHLEQLAKILEDPEASDNDRYVAFEMLKNAVIAAEGDFPMCQDTGTAIVIGKKGQEVWTGYSDEEALSKGIFKAFRKNYFRFSQMAPLCMFDEKNTGSNLPAQIELYATQGDSYKFLFLAKGGGSANKTFLYQETTALLNPEALLPFMIQKMKSLGTAACPPYHLAFVVGGTSAEAALKTVKLASARYLDDLPETGNAQGRAFRDKPLEQRLLKASRERAHPS